jgi:hypothetical protein
MVIDCFIPHILPKKNMGNNQLKKFWKIGQKPGSRLAPKPAWGKGFLGRDCPHLKRAREGVKQAGF